MHNIKKEGNFIIVSILKCSPTAWIWTEYSIFCVIHYKLASLVVNCLTDPSPFFPFYKPLSCIFWLRMSPSTRCLQRTNCIFIAVILPQIVPFSIDVLSGKANATSLFNMIFTWHPFRITQCEWFLSSSNAWLHV